MPTFCGKRFVLILCRRVLTEIPSNRWRAFALVFRLYCFVGATPGVRVSLVLALNGILPFQSSTKSLAPVVWVQYILAYHTGSLPT